ncbi:MAG: hypothetical protein WCK49_06735 [Myxococcaceae bacterium]
MKMLLIDGNTKEFPAYLENMAKIAQPLELLYTDTIEAGLRQIKKGGIGLVLLAGPLFSSGNRIRDLDPDLKIIEISGPKDKVFLNFKECIA